MKKTLSLIIVFLISVMLSACSTSNSSSPEGQSPLSGTRQTEVVLDSPAFTSQRLSSAEIVSEADCSIEFVTELNRYGNLTYTLTSHSDKIYTCGDSFDLEFQRDNKWYIVPQKKGYSFLMLSCDLLKDTPRTFGELLQWRFSNLPEGRYRIVKKIRCSSQIQQWSADNSFFIASEFDFINPFLLKKAFPRKNR